MKILIINIDRPYRSVYSGAIAASLLKKIPSLKITGLISGPNELLTTTGHFEKIHFFDTEAFFNHTKALSHGDIEKEIQKVLSPVKDQEWDVVINLSSNLLGSVFVNFLKAKEVRGASLDSDLVNLRYSDPSSFLLANVPDDFRNFFHFSYLYRSMLKRHEEVLLTSVWEGKTTREFSAHFDELKKKKGKSDIVLIDTGLMAGNRQDEIDFLAELYQECLAHPDLLPIFIGKELKDGHPLLQRLKEDIEGEIYALNSKNEAQLAVVSMASLVVTDDFYLKSVTDIALRPSILLSKTLNLCDYSVINRSHQLVYKTLDSELVNVLVNVAGNIAMNTDSTQSGKKKSAEVFETKNIDNLPILVPKSGSSPEYAQWLLGVRFLAHLQEVKLSTVEVDKGHYKRALSREREMLGKKVDGSIYSMALEMATSRIKNPLIDEKRVIENLNKFFVAEESLF